MRPKDSKLISRMRVSDVILPQLARKKDHISCLMSDGRGVLQGLGMLEDEKVDLLPKKLSLESAPELVI